MIEVKNIAKHFGELVALQDISFTVKKGDVLGFLGPNGAGKTTTMRIISCFMPATKGTVKVGGYDVFENSREIKKIIGYLPEHPPLYPDMTVESYLNYVSKLKDVPRKRRKSLYEKVVETCGLKEVSKRIIKNLSKGYQQRVGIAQAIVHEPQILILDEPTIGLDPRQITDIRNLIKGLSGEHTIILSTHILPEVTMTCNRVVIINKGKLVAEDTYDKLTSQSDQEEKTFIQIARVDAGEAIKKMLSIPGVTRVSQEEKGFLVENSPGETDKVREAISSLIVTSGWGLLQARPLRPTLEDVFLKLITEEIKN